MQEKRDEVKIRLFRNHLTQVWLISQLEKMGINTDRAELCGVLSGARKGDKVNRIIDTSLIILDKYEKALNVQN